MKKILIKDKKRRADVKSFERKKFILRSIFSNFNFCNTTRWSAFHKLNLLPTFSSKSSISNLCVETIHKKKFNKLSNFSRIVFLRQIRNGAVNGMAKYYK